MAATMTERRVNQEPKRQDAERDDALVPTLSWRNARSTTDGDAGGTRCGAGEEEDPARATQGRAQAQEDDRSPTRLSLREEGVRATNA